MPTPMEAGYIMVAERHAKFVEDHPDGRIETSLEYGSDKLVVVKCQVWKEKGDSATAYLPPDGTGMASMPIPGPTAFTKNSEVENAETSALGRALAMIGYHAKESFASKDEIDMKKTDETVTFTASSPTHSDTMIDREKATPAQLKKLMSWGKKLLGDEKKLREFVKSEVGVYKRTDLTREHISKLFDLFKVMESTGGTVAPMEGVTDE